jgi:protocatechuate 3,4-dioxygenase beta subunit
MKNAARIVLFVVCILWLVIARSVPAHAEVISIGILPVQDESDTQVPPELLVKIGQLFKQNLTRASADILVRQISGLVEPSADIAQLAALGRQQGVRYVVRSGLLGLYSDKAGRELHCDVGLYAELIATADGTITGLRANGAGSEDDPARDDIRRWEAYDFAGSGFAQTALGQALGSAVDQLAQQVRQTVAAAGQAAPESGVAESHGQPPDSEEVTQEYETDQELQQLIAQADSLVAGGAASGADISALQQLLEALRTALDSKVSLLTEGRDTSAADQEIARLKNELQNAMAGSTQEAIAAPPGGESSPPGGELQAGIATINTLLSEALNSLLKIQEIRTALQSFSQDQAAAVPDAGGEYVPQEEPTSEVSGVVFDESGNPVEGATVTDPQSGASATTDSSGSYLIPHIPSRRFATMKVFKAGRQLSSGMLQLQPGRPAFADWRIGTGGTAMQAAGIRILPATLIVSARTGAQAARAGTIKGVVRDAQGRPVSRALVLVRGVGVTRTDSLGRYAFVNVPSGEYQLMIRKGGATVQTERVRVAARKVVESKTLYAGRTTTAPASGRLSGLAIGSGAALAGTVRSTSRQPLAGAKVTAVSAGGAMSVYTDGTGSYLFKGVKQGNYRLLANKAGFREAAWSVPVRGASREVHDFMLEKSSAEIQKVLSVRPLTTPGGARSSGAATRERPPLGAKGHLVGAVRDRASGKPIDSVAIRVFGQRTVRTDRQGSYQISDLPPGTYRITVSHRDYQAADKTVTVRANLTTKEVFVLEGRELGGIRTAPPPLLLRPAAQHGLVRGRIVDSKTGRPVAQATVTLLSKKTQSDASGDYSFGTVPAGSYTMTIEKSNYLQVRRRITVDAGKTTTADVRLAPTLGVQPRTRTIPSLIPIRPDAH